MLGLAVLMYAQDYNDTLPPMKDAITVQTALFPYVKNTMLFAHPSTHEPYLPNPALSGKRISQIRHPSQMVVLYEPSPEADGTRGVLFLDGRARRIPEAAWPRLKQTSKIP
jgi:hypothetical protein